MRCGSTRVLCFCVLCFNHLQRSCSPLRCVKPWSLTRSLALYLYSRFPLMRPPVSLCLRVVFSQGSVNTAEAEEKAAKLKAAHLEKELTVQRKARRRERERERQ